MLSTGHAELQPEDGRLAIASVLVMAARADGKYETSEEATIDRVLMTRFKLTAAQARSLREEGEVAEAEAVDIYQFTKAIKEAIPYDDRLAVVEELWGVILSDGEHRPVRGHADARSSTAGFIADGWRPRPAEGAGRGKLSRLRRRRPATDRDQVWELGLMNLSGHAPACTIWRELVDR